MDKLYKIENGDVTIYVRSGIRGSFEFEKMTIKNKPGIVFKTYVYKEEENMVSIGEYVYKKLKNIIDQRLQQYVKDNISRYDFYTKKSEYNENIFFERFYTFKDKYTEKRCDYNTSLNDIVEGIATLSVNNCKCKFNLVKDEFIDMTPLSKFYSEHDLNLMVAIEQYKQGTAHKIFTEIVNLNKFLEGKKSIKLILKDGRVIDLKCQYGVSVSKILRLIKDKFYIDDNYDMKPRLGEKLPLEALDYLQFGKKQYRINIENLVF